LFEPDHRAVIPGPWQAQQVTLPLTSPESKHQGEAQRGDASRVNAASSSSDHTLSPREP
jgi:hypothetical protein